MSHAQLARTRSDRRLPNSAFFAIRSLILIASMLSLNAFAAVQVVLSTVDPTVVPRSTTLNATDAVIISRTLVNGGSIASASADLSAGILRSYSNSALPLAAPQSVSEVPSASARALLSDTIAFGSSASGVVFLDWGFVGDIFVNPAKFGYEAYSQAFLDLTLFPLSGGTTLSFEAALTTSPTCPAAATICVRGTSVALAGSVPIPVLPSSGYAITATLSTVGRMGDAVRFDNTSYLYLRNPDGVSITSGSGVFLSTAQPVPSIPEPPAWFLLLAGLAFVARAAPWHAPCPSFL